MMRSTLLLPALALAPCLIGGAIGAEPPRPEHPKIRDHGGVFRIAGDPEPPRQGSKVVVDVTSGEVASGGVDVNKGFARAARFVNLFALGGVDDFKMAIVLHGVATKEALSDEAYRKFFGKPNPNLPLARRLRAAGVEILVCGQALTHAGYDPSQTAPEVETALSAATAIINRQARGFAYLPIQ